MRLTTVSPIGEREVVQTDQPLVDRLAKQVERTLKIKQCMTRTKHTQYPLILTQYEKNPAMRNYCHTDANERQ